MKESKAIIRIDGVTKKFGSFAAVSDVSFSIDSGEIVGFVGENGAGKTTTINMLLGFTSPTTGTVEVFGEKMYPAVAHKVHRHWGYASGDMALADRMTGEQYIRFVMSQTPGSHEKRFKELTAAFKPQLSKKISTLSRGNKQKIALVAAFVTGPKLVVLDEPTSGLDPVMQDVFLDTIRAESQRGTTVFMSSHYLQEVAEVSSRVLLMKSGKIVEDLSSEQLEKRGGKIVTVVTSRSVTLPKTHTVDVVTRKRGNNTETSFGYTGEISALQKWLGGLTGVIDLSINDRTLEHEFRALYESGRKDNENK